LVGERSIRGSLHTHPKYAQDDPSDDDKELAKKTNQPTYVVSKRGLFMIRPRDQKVIQVFEGTDWMQPDKKSNEKK
jgi:hypothetical protein